MVKIFMRQFPLVGAYLAMKPILAVFWNICLLRRGPELVPTHPLFVGGVIVLNVLVGFFVGVQASEANAVQVATSTLVSMAAHRGDHLDRFDRTRRRRSISGDHHRDVRM